MLVYYTFNLCTVLRVLLRRTTTIYKCCLKDSKRCIINMQGRNQVISGKRKPKTNFVEVRTFLHLYRSFDRMWVFFILLLQVILWYLATAYYCRYICFKTLFFQAMVIVAWNHNGSLAVIFEEKVFKNILSIFITLAILNFLQGIYNSLTLRFPMM